METKNTNPEDIRKAVEEEFKNNPLLDKIKDATTTAANFGYDSTNVNGTWQEHNPYGLSTSNPYLLPYLRAENSTRKRAYLKAALEWEAQQASTAKTYQREDELLDRARQNELEDRAHTEEYNDPAAQAARLRAAGINPDISGEVSAGETQDLDTPVGTASADQGMPTIGNTETESDNPFTNLILPAVSTALSFVPAIGTAVSAGLDIVRNSVQLEQLGAQNRKTDAETNSIYNSGVESDFAFLANSAATLSKTLDENGQPKPLTKKRFLDFLQSSGRQFTGDSNAMVDAFLNNADIQSMANRSAENYRESAAFSAAGSIDYYMDLADHTYRTRAHVARLQDMQAEVSARIGDMVYSDPTYAENSATEMKNQQQLAVDSSSAALDADLPAKQIGATVAQNQGIKEHYEAMKNTYVELVNYANNEISNIDRQLEKLRNPDGTVPITRYPEYMALKSSRASLMVQTYDSLTHISDALNDYYRLVSASAAINPSFVKGDPTAPTNNQNLRRHYIIWRPGEDPIDAYQAAFGYLDKAISIIK